MEFINFLKKESKELDRRLLIAGTLAGVLNTILIFFLSTAARNIAAGQTAYTQMIGVALCLAGFWVSKGYLLRRSVQMVEGIVYNIRLRISEKIRRTDLRAFELMDRAAIYNAVSLHSLTISRSTLVIVSSATSLVLVVCAFIIILFKSTAAFFILTGALALILMSIFGQQSKILAAYKKSTAQDNLWVSRFTDLLDGFKELKMNTAKNQDFFDHDLVTAADKSRELRIKSGQIANHNVLLAASALFILLAAVVFLLPVVSADTSKLIFISSLIIFIIGPMGEVVSSYSILADVTNSILEIYRIEKKLDTAFETGEESHIPKNEEAESEAAPFREIRCDQMSFAYHNEKGESSFSLEPFDFKLTAGEIVFITGGNGSGKSTFLKVLAGLYPPDAGAIMLNDQPIAGANLPAYRNLFSPIFTDFHLFETLYGIPDVDEAVLNHWLHRTDLIHKTKIAERKISDRDLSTGQRKRLALVLALLEDKPILLLDEWAAEQDPKFRRTFYREILPELKAAGKTIIAVSHDDDHYEVADRTLKMNFGQFMPHA